MNLYESITNNIAKVKSDKLDSNNKFDLDNKVKDLNNKIYQAIENMKSISDTKFTITSDGQDGRDLYYQVTEQPGDYYVCSIHVELDPIGFAKMEASTQARTLCEETIWLEYPESYEPRPDAYKNVETAMKKLFKILEAKSL